MLSRYLALLICLQISVTTLAGEGLKSAEKLQKLIDRRIDNKRVFGITVSVQKGTDSWTGYAGKLDKESSYFIASTTKLYVTAIILQLRQEGLIGLDDPISKYLPADILKGLHLYKGKEYTGQITIRHLLAHTSGLPDYFETKRKNAPSLRNEISAGKDQHWTTAEAIALSKKMKPKFVPGKKGKALYSDTNFQLLGYIIETVTHMSFAEAVQQRICAPLGLKQTYVYTNANDTIPANMYYKNKPLLIPIAMTSFGADGGIVSTTTESMVFLRAFFNGKLFPVEYVTEIQQNWNPIFYPLKYGVGLAKFQLPAAFTMFKKYPALLGHSGLSGAFAYYSPEKDIWLTGTVNQVANPSISYKLMVQLITEIIK